MAEALAWRVAVPRDLVPLDDLTDSICHALIDELCYGINLTPERTWGTPLGTATCRSSSRGTTLASHAR